MQNKFDFGSVLILIGFILAIIVIIYLAWANFVSGIKTNTSSAAMYSRPTWPDPPETTVTETTEETEEPEPDEEEYYEEEYNDYE